MAQSLAMLNQLTHEICDPQRNYKDDIWMSNQISFYLGISCSIVGMIMMVGNINIYFSCFLLMFYNIGVLIYISNVNVLNDLFMSLIQSMVLIFFILASWAISSQNASKQNFMRKNKIERLLNEQKVILNNIPDGAMIFNEL